MLPSMEPDSTQLLAVSYAMLTMAAVWHRRLIVNASLGLSSLSNS
jgi:hypothetical protein